MVTVPIIEKGGFFPRFQVICNGFIFYDSEKDEGVEQEHLRSISYYDFNIWPN